MDLAENLKERFSILPNFIDDIRIVDPLSKQIISVDDETGIIKSHNGTCYKSLSKCTVCQNCVSYRSFLKHDTFVKIERVEGKKPVRIISTPVNVGHKTFIAEMLKEIDYTIAGNEDVNLNENISIMMDNMNKKIVTDQLTGIYNRRFIDERINSDIYSQRSNKRMYTMVMADVDYFKKINDTYGHPAGDMVLKEVSRLIKSTVDNESGWVARYGGEEFIFVYYDKTLDEVVKSVEDIRNTLEDKEFIYNDTKIKVTASFGVTELSEKHKDGEALLKDVDSMLYTAKQNGRNRIEYING